MLRISTDAPPASRSIGSPDAERMATLNKELTVSAFLCCLPQAPGNDWCKHHVQLQVQDFKAGFEFLFRKMSELKDVEQQLKLSQDRVRELEAELAAQLVRTLMVCTVALFGGVWQWLTRRPRNKP
jgi:hypothetical protein